MNGSSGEWNPPDWHPDWGDPRIELEHLKEFSLRLVSVIPTVSLTLETPEPGLMTVCVRSKDGKVAEVHSIASADSPKKRRLALFFTPGTPNEEEVYADSIDCAVGYFSARFDR
jgi:hypothetical protein